MINLVTKSEPEKFKKHLYKGCSAEYSLRDFAGFLSPNSSQVEKLNVWLGDQFKSITELQERLEKLETAQQDKQVTTQPAKQYKHLTPTEVGEIKWLLQNSNLQGGQIAELYGSTPSSVSYIKRGYGKKHQAAKAVKPRVFVGDVEYAI